MMERDEDGDLGTREEIYAELKMRSLARPDSPEIAFWAANVGYCIIGDTKNNRHLVDSISDLAVWLSSRGDWPDMSDVIAEMVANEWITQEFQLGRVPIEALESLWAESLSAVRKRNGDMRFDNEVRSTREELEEAMRAHDDPSWIGDLRERIRVLELRK